MGSDELTQRVVRALNAQARAVGIDLNLLALDADHLWGEWVPGPRFQAAVLVVRDPSGGDLRGRFGTPGSHNVSRLADQALRRALDGSDRTLDDTSALVDAPHERVSELVSVIPLSLLEVTIAARAGINGVVASSAADGFLWDAAGWWREGATSSPSPSPSGS